MIMKKVAFITGGARGIGKAISERFAKEGYNLIINYKENDIRAKEIKNNWKKNLKLKL